MSAQMPSGEPVRPNRDSPLRTASGPPSAAVPLPACLSGLLTDHATAKETS